MSEVERNTEAYNFDSHSVDAHSAHENQSEKTIRHLTIVNKKGLHARATAKFVQCAERFDAEIHITRADETVSATSIMGILTLGAGIGTVITVAASGTQALEAIDALDALVADKFGEGE